MIGIVVNKLEQLQDSNVIAKELVTTYKGKRKVEVDYTKTPYGSFRNYIKNMLIFNGWLKGEFKKDLLDTNLIFIKTNQPVNFMSREDQGVGFGWTLVDYVTKRPIIMNYTDFLNDENVYQKSLLDLRTGEYVNSAKTLVSDKPLIFGEEIMAEVKNQIEMYQFNK